MSDFLQATAFTLWGSPTSVLEALAFVLALAMVGCNIREIHWGWPLAAISSGLYFLLFWQSKLYGDAALQVFFALMALWGWWQWLRGHADDGSALHIQPLSPRGRLGAVLTCALLWPVTGWFLLHFTDTDVPWWDAFPTAASVLGQWLLGRKYLENWPVWLLVNTVSVGLFVYKSLWLTALLYLIFIALSAVGWRAWQRRLAAA
jgi:nicotinamide mononucleotide transporter